MKQKSFCRHQTWTSLLPGKPFKSVRKGQSMRRSDGNPAQQTALQNDQ